MHGLEVCRRIRQRSDVPIIIVTAHGDSHDVVAGLEAGADDYVTKPFVAKELAARIRAAVRRAQSVGLPHAATRQFRDLELHSGSAFVTKRGEEVRLTATEFRLLRDLVDNAGLLLSREQLLERVWGYDYLGDNRVVDAHIRRLRAKLEDDPANPTYVVTVRGLGYRFEP